MIKDSEAQKVQAVSCSWTRGPPKRGRRKEPRRNRFFFSLSLFSPSFFFDRTQSVQLARRLIRSANGSHAPLFFFLPTLGENATAAFLRVASPKAYDAIARDKEPTVGGLQGYAAMIIIKWRSAVSSRKQPYASRPRHALVSR